jgi:tRNA (guanine37-N1)-methyltransferase
MKFTFVSLFPNLIAPYFEDSILKKGLDKKLFEIDFYNPRDFSKDKLKKVDDYMCGGGAGLLMSPQPLNDCLTTISKNDDTWVIFPTPAGKPFNQKDAKRLAFKKHIIFVSGRYEGIDERIIEKFADEVFSIGDFILTGGELPSITMCDAICRNIPGVLGNGESLKMESFEDDLIEAPSFTKPDIFEDLSIISEFLKGNHSKIADLKKQMSIYKTKYYRPQKGKNDEK